MGKTTKKFDRKFLGKLTDFEDKPEQRKEQAHLKAYKRGRKTFTFGRDLQGIPISHPVLEEIINN